MRINEFSQRRFDQTQSRQATRRVDTYQRLAQQVDGGANSSGYHYGLGMPVEPTTGIESLRRSHTNYLDRLQQMTHEGRMNPHDQRLKGVIIYGKADHWRRTYAAWQGQSQEETRGNETQDASPVREVSEIRTITKRQLGYCLSSVRNQANSDVNMEQFMTQLEKDHQLFKQLIDNKNFAELTRKMCRWRQNGNTAEEKYADHFFIQTS
jgi:hypothetical protein